jgi:hypothetical protein
MSIPLRVDNNILAFSIPTMEDFGFDDVFKTLTADVKSTPAMVDAIEVGLERYQCDITGKQVSAVAYLIDLALFSDAAVENLIDLVRTTGCQQIILVNHLGEAVDMRDADVPVWVGYWQESSREPDIDVFDYFSILNADTMQLQYYIADKLNMRGAKKRAVNI